MNTASAKSARPMIASLNFMTVPTEEGGGRPGRPPPVSRLRDADGLHDLAEIAVTLVHERFEALRIGIDRAEAARAHEVLVLFRIVDLFEHRLVAAGDIG